MKVLNIWRADYWTLRPEGTRANQAITRISFHHQCVLLPGDLQREDESAYGKRNMENEPENDSYWWCHAEGRGVSRFTCYLKWLVCISRRGRENRGTIREQLVSSDRHKLLCLHLTRTATHFIEAETRRSTVSVVTTECRVKKEKKNWQATRLILPVCINDGSIGAGFSSPCMMMMRGPVWRQQV